MRLIEINRLTARVHFGFNWLFVFCLFSCDSNSNNYAFFCRCRRGSCLGTTSTINFRVPPPQISLIPLVFFFLECFLRQHPLRSKKLLRMEVIFLTGCRGESKHTSVRQDLSLILTRSGWEIWRLSYGHFPQHCSSSAPLPPTAARAGRLCGAHKTPFSVPGEANRMWQLGDNYEGDEKTLYFGGYKTCASRLPSPEPKQAFDGKDVSRRKAGLIRDEGGSNNSHDLRLLIFNTFYTGSVEPIKPSGGTAAWEKG